MQTIALGGPWPLSLYPTLNSKQVILLSNTGNQIASTFSMPPLGEAITHLGCLVDQIVGTAPEYKISLRNIAADGYPGTTIHTSGTFTPTSTGKQRVSVSPSFTPTTGTMYGLLVEYSSGTVSGSNHARFTVGWNNALSVGSPRGRYYQFGSWFESNKGPFGWSVEGATNRVFLPMIDFANTSITGANDRLTNRFKISANAAASSVDVRGIVFSSDTASGSDVRYGIWNDAGTELAGATIDTDSLYLTDGVLACVYFSSAVTLNKDTVYYAGVSNDGTAQTTESRAWEVDEHDDLLAYPGWQDNPKDIYMATWNGSSWTTTNTKRLELALLVESETGGGGGGGDVAANLGRTLTW